MAKTRLEVDLGIGFEGTYGLVRNQVPGRVRVDDYSVVDRCVHLLSMMARDWNDAEILNVDHRTHHVSSSLTVPVPQEDRDELVFAMQDIGFLLEIDDVGTADAPVTEFVLREYVRPSKTEEP